MAKEKYVVDWYECICTRYIYMEGCDMSPFSCWGSGEAPVKGKYDTISAALNAVMSVNCFTEDALWSITNDADFGGDERITFHCSLLVDVNNEEASEYQIREWKEGRQNLWCCDISVSLKVVMERELTAKEIPVEYTR